MNRASCGLGLFRPRCLQSCAKVGVFTGVWSIFGLLTQAIGVYIVSQITTLEKQFGFSSFQSGFIISCNEIGFILATFFVSHSASKVHIPVGLWVATVVYGIGGLVCALTYVVSMDHIQQQTGDILQAFDNQAADSLVGRFSPNATLEADDAEAMSSQHIPLCIANTMAKQYLTIPKNSSNSSNAPFDCVPEELSPFGIGLPNKRTKLALGLLGFGMLIQGMAKSTRLPFSVHYIDDNVQDKKDTAMHFGIQVGAILLGPVLGLALGAVFSRQYVTLQDMPISARHPAWIGAWWLGFVVFGVLAVVTPVPLLCFPRRLKPRAEDQATAKDNSQHPRCFYFKDLLETLLRTIKNATYLLTLLALAFTMMAVASVIVFMPKYLENQFSIPTWKANATYAGLNILVACVGTAIGGIVISKARLSPLACMRLLIVLSLAGSVTLCLGFVFGCDNVDIVGIHDGWKNQTKNTLCHHACGCHSNVYFPVCGSNNVNYMSPCQAGCSRRHDMAFSDCSCVGENGTAVAGLCRSSCDKMLPYMASSAVTVFLICFGLMCYAIIMLRSVQEKYKGVAIGFASFAFTFFGWFLSPILMGKLIDTTCEHWYTSCEGRGACAVYNTDSLRIRFHSAILVLFGLSFVFMLAAYCMGRRKTDWSGGESGETEEPYATEAMLDYKGRNGGRDEGMSQEDWSRAKESCI